MSNPFKNQYTADGIGTDFVYSFAVPINRAVLVYETLAGNQANEDTDLVSNTLYTIIPDNPSASTSTGIVRFNAAPADQSVITITPDQATLVTYVFSNTAPFNTDNLNGSFEQEAQTNGYNLQNFLQNSIRYNVNENDGDLAYDNKVSPLSDNGFWRRIGAEIVSQDFDSFVGEVSAIVLEKSEAQTNAGADNTNLTNEIASNDQGVPYSGTPKRVDPSGNIILDPAINGFSAKAGALWAQAWAESLDQINDDYGNSGRSARFYSNQAAIAAGSATGVIDQLRIFDNVSTTTQVDLINYDTNEPWINVLENSLSVYINGERLQEPTVYSPPSTPATSDITYTVTIKDPPTLGDPSFITFSSAIPANSEIWVTRGEAQGDGSTMFRRFNNALPSPETDLNTTISKAPLWGAKNVLDGATSSGDWSGGYSVVVDDGVDSASVQMQITHESDSTPEIHVRSNLTTGSTTLNPSNFSSWYKALTVSSQNVVKQVIASLAFDNSTGSISIQKQPSTGSRFDVFSVEQTDDTQGDGVAKVFGNLFAGAGANLPVNTSSMGLDKYIEVVDQKNTVTDGGSSIVGFQTRTLNTIISNTLGASLSNNRLTLEAGDYMAFASAPAYRSGSNQISITNEASDLIILGTSEYTGPNIDGSISNSIIFGEFTLDSQQMIKIEHFIASSFASSGLGIKSGSNSLYGSRYARLIVWKIR